MDEEVNPNFLDGYKDQICARNGLLRGTLFIGMKIPDHGGLQQRWLFVFSQQAYQREQETFYRKLKKAEKKLKKDVWHLSNKAFSTHEEAEKACRDLDVTVKYHDLHYTINTILKHKGRGRPKCKYSAEPCLPEKKSGTHRIETCIK